MLSMHFIEKHEDENKHVHMENTRPDVCVCWRGGGLIRGVRLGRRRGREGHTGLALSDTL